ncbi:MAG: hypothetical protein SPK06_01865, partial [Kiritimatiellia bacterium]|nr:hypothetical protein [Kiritimatiellia bacterium]
RSGCVGADDDGAWWRRSGCVGADDDGAWWRRGGCVGADDDGARGRWAVVAAGGMATCEEQKGC